MRPREPKPKLNVGSRLHLWKSWLVVKFSVCVVSRNVNEREGSSRIDEDNGSNSKVSVWCVHR